MSSRVGSNLEEISRYLDRMKEQRRVTELAIIDLEREKKALDDKIEELGRKKADVEERLRVERERAARQERSLHQGEITYAKLLDSSQSLADFVKKEYQDTKRE